jgi:hypothetical protein
LVNILRKNNRLRKRIFTILANGAAFQPDLSEKNDDIE